MEGLIPCPTQISTPVIQHIPKKKKDLAHLDTNTSFDFPCQNIVLMKLKPTSYMSKTNWVYHVRPYHIQLLQEKLEK
jgi:hypothetical protein